MIHLRRFLQFILMSFSILIFFVGSAQAGSCELPNFSPFDFTSPTTNLYFPIPETEGATYVYEAETDDELVLNVIFISNETREVYGVECTVVYDTEWVYVEEEDDWFVTETTEDWHAWDNFGNFWYFGEWTSEFGYDENWNYTGCNHVGSWEAGVDGAEPGIIIPVDPSPGDCLLQEYYEDEAEDRGRILRLNAEISIEIDGTEYESGDCLVTKEWTKLEPGNVEHKYYMPDVGLVFIEELKEKTVEVELIDYYDGAPHDYGLPTLVCP